MKILGSFWLRPRPLWRLEFLRITLPLALVAFYASRLRYADEWLGQRGFHPPDLGGDWRQPLYLPPLPDAAAWGLAAVLVLSAAALSLGFRARPAAGVLAAATAYVALADRLAAFTVSKLAPVLCLALAAAPVGSRWGLDAWRCRGPKPTLARGGLPFFELLLPIFYCASGCAKWRGDWLTHPYVLWTHLHDSYQTSFSHALAGLLPPWAWTLFQGMTLLFETLAPLWFAWRRTRAYAWLFGLGMHTLIGLLFGPVAPFALLMLLLLIGTFTPETWVMRWAKHGQWHLRASAAPQQPMRSYG